MSPAAWAREVLAEAMAVARAAGDTPEAAAEAHLFDCWMEAGALDELAEAIEHATLGAVVLDLPGPALITPRPF